MPTKKPAKNNIASYVVYTLLVVALAVGGYYVFSFINQPNREAGSVRSQSVSDDSKDKEKNKTDQESSETTKKEKKLPKQYEGEDQLKKSDKITMVINSKEVVDGKLSIRLTINQLLSGGSCKLILIGNKTVIKTADIVQNPSSSSCMGFDVPVSQLGSGNWSIKIEVKSADKTGVIEDSIKI